MLFKACEQRSEAQQRHWQVAKEHCKEAGVVALRQAWTAYHTGACRPR